jgi:signal transduction histidine kinase
MADLQYRSLTGGQVATVAVGISIMLLPWGLDALSTGSGTGSFLHQIWHPGSHRIAVSLWYLIALLFMVLGLTPRAKVTDSSAELALTATFAAGWPGVHAALEGVGVAITMQGLDMRILYQNRAHIELMGEHLGEYCYEAYQKQGSVCPDCHLAEAFKDGMTRKTEKDSHDSHGLRFFEIVCNPLRDTSGRIVAGIESVREITGRMRADLKLEWLNRELELRALELAESYREMESFGYSLSHDLRSYLTRISTAQQIMALTREAKERDLEYPLQIIEDSCREMAELIDAILTLSRLSRETLNFEEVSLGEMAQEVALLLQQQELSRQVVFSIPSTLQATGDRHLLRIVLENLLGNSWKYTRGVPVARIELGTGLQDGKHFFFVRDNGIGFDMAERDKLFRPFQRLQSAQGFPGTGVGLATVERAIQRHLGEVWGEGEPGKGTTIYFTLPEDAQCQSTGSGARNKISCCSLPPQL